MDSFVVSTMSRAPRIIERGTAHAAMIFTDLLRKEQYELKRATSASSSSSSLGGASPRSQSPRSPRSARTRTSSQPENRLRFGQESRVGQNGNGGGAGSDASHGGGGSSTAGSEVALDAGTTSRARDAFSLIYEETIDAVFAIESALEPLAGPPAPLPWEIKGLR